MKRVQPFNVSPAMPEELAFVEMLARNMWWCWHDDSIELFRRINPRLWRESGRSPLEFLSRIPQSRLEALAGDEAFLSHLEQVRDRFEREVSSSADADTEGPRCVAYGSLEYGIHESVHLYSGGLGVLAGDHLKAASDLGLPLVALGLLYQQGYFVQSLDRDGWQQEYYPDNQFNYLPLSEARDREGRSITVTLPLPEGELEAVVWRLDVGRVPLYLLDANIQSNSRDFRQVTWRLYGGDRKTRLRQELLLGVGGFQALIELGLEPQACHMNEGHSAFLNLARLGHLMRARGLDRDAALEVVYRSGVFTTHTPVPAGNETFALELLRPHLEALEPTLGVPPDTVLEWGRQPGATKEDRELSMTILALRTAWFGNGVSELHGGTARRMWRHLWPEHPEDEIPIGHITNGVHAPSWVSAEIGRLFDRYVENEWRGHPADERSLELIDHIPDEELWRAHEMNRSHLVGVVRRLSEEQLSARHSSPTEIQEARSLLDPDALTIGFARRFTTYKRAVLLLSDPERLLALLGDEERPIQLVFAGKAHPHDEAGKKFIQEIVRFSRRPEVKGRIAFLEDYDISIARALVHGVDVWLNLPRRPQEASGTSGMKAAMNGALNVSVLDGWWCEGYSPDCGWAVGKGEEHGDKDYQDAVEARSLYNLLENEVVPRFYDRDARELPEAWLQMMKESMRMGLGSFTSHRMVQEYDARFYAPAVRACRSLLADDGRPARELVEQRRRLSELWSRVSCSLPETDRDLSRLRVGDRFAVTSTVDLGRLAPEEVDVEVYFGPVDSESNITAGQVESMEMVESKGDGLHIFRRELHCRHTGRYAFTVRVTPHGEEWKRAMPGFLTWAGER